MNGLAGLISFGISVELVQSVNSLSLSSEQQSAFLQKAERGYVWGGENENGRTCLKVRALTIRIFYEKNNRLLPLWGECVTETESRQMPFKIALYLKKDSEVAEVGAKMIFDQFGSGKFSMQKPQFHEENWEVDGVPVTRELIGIKIVTQEDMSFPIIKRVSS